MDLSNFTSDRANIPSEVVILHPVTKKPTDFVISVVGMDSTAAQACLDAQQARRFKAMRAEVGDEPEYDAEQNRKDTLELLVACTVGWKNAVFNGAELEFTPENAAMIYEKIPVVRDQVSAATGSRARFFKD